ncbi:MAG: hypothetical protein RLP02_01050 [Coleofasciculus sp. C2-GNP5-27]
MRLPDALLEHPEVWKSIYTQAASEHETRLRLRDWAVGMDGGYGELMRQVVTKAFQQLAEQMGREVAVDLAAIAPESVSEKRDRLELSGRTDVRPPTCARFTDAPNPPSRVGITHL